MKSKINLICILVLMFLLISGVSCKRSKVEEPSPLGPSTFAVVLNVSAKPNVLFAGSATREITTITATLNKYDGIPLSNESVQFDIRDALGNRIYLGYFEGGESVKIKTTDQNGRVSIDYYGPTAEEMYNQFAESSKIYIYAVVRGEGKEYIAEFAPIYIVRDIIEIIFELTADPNVVWATDERPQANIIASVKKADGVPLSGRKVYFSVLSGPGKFEDSGTKKTYAFTNDDGLAIVTYLGPTRDEMKFDQVAKLRGHLEISGPDQIHVEVDIKIYKGNQ